MLEGNRRGLKPRINLAAYIVGNGVTDAEYDGNAIVPFAAGKSLLSQAMFNKARRACDGGSFWNARDGSECAERLDGVWVRRLRFLLSLPFSTLNPSGSLLGSPRTRCPCSLSSAPTGALP